MNQTENKLFQILNQMGNQYANQYADIGMITKVLHQQTNQTKLLLTFSHYLNLAFDGNPSEKPASYSSVAEYLMQQVQLDFAKVQQADGDRFEKYHNSDFSKATNICVNLNQLAMQNRMVNGVGMVDVSNTDDYHLMTFDQLVNRMQKLMSNQKAVM